MSDEEENLPPQFYTDPRAKQVIVPGSRVIERGRGCYNCLHWDNGPDALADLKLRLDAEARELPGLERLGDYEHSANPAKNARFNIAHQLMAHGAIGKCGSIRGQAPGVFVHAKFFHRCWEGRDGASLATSGKPMDELPEDLVQAAEEGMRTVKPEDLGKRVK